MTNSERDYGTEGTNVPKEDEVQNQSGYVEPDKQRSIDSCPDISGYCSESVDVSTFKPVNADVASNHAEDGDNAPETPVGFSFFGNDLLMQLDRLKVYRSNENEPSIVFSGYCDSRDDEQEVDGARVNAEDQESVHGGDAEPAENTGESIETLENEAQHQEESEPDVVTDDEPGASSEELPEIVHNRLQPREVIEVSRDIMLSNQEAYNLFLYGGDFVTIRSKANGYPEITEISKDMLLSLLLEMITWKTATRAEIKDTIPPSYLLRSILAEPDSRIRPLTSVVTVPVFGSNLNLLQKPGYDPATGIVFMPPEGFAIPEVPEIPTLNNILRAVSLLLDEMLCNFPFVDQGSRAHIIAALLIPFLRLYLDKNCVPLHLLDSYAPGSGKNLLADCVSLIATGRRCTPTAAKASDAELRKRLVGQFMRGTNILLLDNMAENAVVDSSVLASMLTADTFQDRLLGGNKIIEIKNRALWLLTGNNVRLSHELIRRSIRIRLDAGTERPWERNNFKHPELINWVYENRSDLIWACLTIVQYWKSKGCPLWNGKPLGSFERWSLVMGGILDAVGIEGFLSNQGAMVSDIDIEAEQWHTLFTYWWEWYGDQPVKASDVAQLCADNELLDGVLGSGGIRSQRTRIGLELKKRMGRTYGTYRIVADNSSIRSSARYCLEQVSPPVVAEQ